MTYKLHFLEIAEKEWRNLDNTVRSQFKKKLTERLEDPHVESAQLSGMPGCYKIKLRASGYRLVYRVDNGLITVTVISVGKRDRLEVYKSALLRM